MPLYSYRCPHEHTHELVTSSTERDQTRNCPVCAEPARRQISLVAGYRLGKDGFLVRSTQCNPHAV
ncbi:MAG: FmdB family zinc ribbon protein [Chloroflexota bacterium]